MKTKKSYYTRNKEKINAKARARYLIIREEKKAEAREYYHNNKDKRKEYELKNKDKLKKYRKAYYKVYYLKNIDKIKAQVKAYRIRVRGIRR